MPIAAVPKYLGTDFQQASPGMRFGMYLKLWGVNRRSNALLWETYDINYEVRGLKQELREVKYENKVAALSDAKKLNENDKKTMTALFERQKRAYEAIANSNSLLRLESIATAPFTTGLGNEHPLENGFAFLNPYGLPYLPGSGVKGVLRQAARELASGVWGDAHGWSDDKSYSLRIGDEIVRYSMFDAFFGLESRDGETNHIRGALSFWDVIPQIKGDSLMVEIMTPHQGHYYQQKPYEGNIITPHESGQPNPISFLTVPPGSGFIFHVLCDLAHLRRLAPDLAEEGRWKTLLHAAFEHAFEWLGFGAKTAVGYGAMKEITDGNAAIAAETVSVAAFRQTRSTMQPEVLNWNRASLDWNPGNATLTATYEGKKAQIQIKNDRQIVPNSIQKKLFENRKTVYAMVTVEKTGNLLKIVKIELPEDQ